MKVIKDAQVTSTPGFKAGGIASGVKNKEKLDLGVLISDVPATTAAVYTTNSVKAAPLKVCVQHLKDGVAQAIVVNSGNANCFTGKMGYSLAQNTAQFAGELLGIKKEDVLVASTGIIGQILPYDKIAAALPELAKSLSPENAAGKSFAEATLTTDKYPKSSGVEVEIGSKTVTIVGCAKGSGMLAPNMATMLSFITTDCDIEHSLLQEALLKSVNNSFNMITVDGCMSTNDMVVVMANGKADNPKIKKNDENYQLFADALSNVCLELAKKLVRDGEGVTKFVEIAITGAESEEDAKRAAFAVANSYLVKTAVFGENPNWGRVAQALGTIGLNITEDTLKINFTSLKEDTVTIHADLGLGDKSATVYTSDLSYEYVRINAEYN